MKILLVDDHAVVRAGMISILAEASFSLEIGEAASYREAMECLRNAEWDAVLLDISLPDKSGIELLKAIKRQWKSLPVLMLSIYPEDQYAVRAMRAGASGYLTKESASDELLKAVEKVAWGGRYISESLAESLASAIDEVSDKAPHETLSDREYTVMCMIASGKTVSEIAEELSLSVKTVSTYRSRILEKLNMQHNAELTHYAIKQGLVE